MEMLKWISAVLLALFVLFFTGDALAEESFVESVVRDITTRFRNLMEVQARILECLPTKDDNLRALGFNEPGLIKGNIDDLREFVTNNSLYFNGLLYKCMNQDFPQILTEPEERKFGLRMARFSVDMAIKTFSACRDVKSDDWDQCVDNGFTVNRKIAGEVYEGKCGKGRQMVRVYECIVTVEAVS